MNDPCSALPRSDTATLVEGRTASSTVLTGWSRIESAGPERLSRHTIGNRAIIPVTGEAVDIHAPGSRMDTPAPAEVHPHCLSLEHLSQAMHIQGPGLVSDGPPTPIGSGSGFS